MNKALITAVMGLGMLYAQSVSANVDRSFVLADASSTHSTPSKKHKAQHHTKKHHKQHHHQYKHEKHHRKHHRNHPHRGYNCPQGNCDEDMGMMDQRAYMRSQAIMGSPDAQINDMDVINRDHAARAGRGR